MYDVQPSVWGVLTSSGFISLPFITPTPFHWHLTGRSHTLICISSSRCHVATTETSEWNGREEWWIDQYTHLHSRPRSGHYSVSQKFSPTWTEVDGQVYWCVQCDLVSRRVCVSTNDEDKIQMKVKKIPMETEEGCLIFDSHCWVLLTLTDTLWFRVKPDWTDIVKPTQELLDLIETEFMHNQIRGTWAYSMVYKRYKIFKNFQSVIGVGQWWNSFFVW